MDGHKICCIWVGEMNKGCINASNNTLVQGVKLWKRFTYLFLAFHISFCCSHFLLCYTFDCKNHLIYFPIFHSNPELVRFCFFSQVIEGMKTLKILEDQETYNERPKKMCLIADCGIFDVAKLWT